MSRDGIAYLMVGGTVMSYHLVNPLRLEHLVMIVAVVLAWNVCKLSREFVIVFLPIMLFAWCYDLLRVFSERAAAMVTIAEVREAELAIFGWWDDGARVGPVEVFLEWNHPVLDLLGAPIYASHVATIIAFGLWLWWSSRGEENPRLVRFLWGFLLLNLVGFCVQVLFPVAPPWYVESFGYALPSGPIGGDPGGLGRVDVLIGVAYFEGIYAQGAYVFGAVPSLHVAYPVWLTLHVYRHRYKVLAGLYAASMAFFAVYYTHHYVLDLIAGAALSLGVYVLFAWTPLGSMAVAFHQGLQKRFLETQSRYALNGSLGFSSSRAQCSERVEAD